MGYAGKYEDRLKAQELRRKGLSYNEIILRINVSKDTLSRWCKDIDLTQEQKSRLMNNKTLGQKKGSLIAAENKKSQRLIHTKEIFDESKKEMGSPTKRDRFIFGLALYAGEGGKSDGKASFVNANPTYISFMVSWFQEFCNIKKEEFRGSIWLHRENDEQAARSYWSEVSEIPTSQLHKTYLAINKPNSKKIRKNIHEHGLFTIKFYKSDKQRKIMGWISAFLGDKIASTQ